MKQIRHNRILNWLMVLLWILVVFSTLSLVVPFSKFLRNLIPLNAVITTLLVLVLVLLTGRFCFDPTISNKRFKGLLWIGALVSYAYGLWLIKIPEEKFHFLEYGLLAWIVVRAMRVDFHGWPLYAGAFIISGLVGCADEAVQYLLPNRVYELRDIGINFLSVFLALVLIYTKQR